MKNAAAISAKIALYTVIVCFFAVIAINLFVCISASGNICTAENADGGYDFILVLGCGLNRDGTPGDLLSDRMKTAIALYKKHGGRLLLSGDNRSFDYNEPKAMKRMALSYGVPEEDIVLDPLGLSTAESVTRAKTVYGAESLVIVTQKYHLYRAVYIARSCGIDALGVWCDDARYSGHEARLLRETAARVKDFAVTLFRKPTAK